ncbi:hypothetical protein [Pseudomonas syringae pv. coryli]|uniref:hypothetical protein n=1 Tax=Pseudomonas syringae pv. coryli TaxID=317659 RepID=UPI003D2B9F7D
MKFVWPRPRHNAQLADLQAQLDQHKARVVELEARAVIAEKAAHEFAEETRYVLEAAAIAVYGSNTNNDLGTIAHALPYLCSGRRHWSEQADPVAAADAKLSAQVTTRKHGFELPSAPVEAVKSILELSCMLLVPAFKAPVEGLRSRYPVAKTKTANLKLV